MSFKEGDEVVVVSGPNAGEQGTLRPLFLSFDRTSSWELVSQSTYRKGLEAWLPVCVSNENIKKIKDLTNLEKIIYNCQEIN
jgi:hypothetical protein